MPRYLIERNFAEEVGLTKEANEGINRINDEEGVDLDNFLPQRRQEKDLLLI